jgi:hypothetical protein
MSPAKSPRGLLELLAQDNEEGREFRRSLRRNPAKVLGDYGVQIPKGKRLPKPARLPSPERIKLALDIYDTPGYQRVECQESFAVLMVVIGAIPFVADGAR